MKVYGGNTFINGKQVRAIVACRRSELPAILGGKASKAYARNYWAQTGNDVEIQVATSRPGVLFWTDKKYGEKTAADYHAVEAAG